MTEPNNVKLIAFYLPQYHPIQENDQWWGKGFTEWTNVTKAKPNFQGHYQPHLPTDLGFYDLRLAEIRDSQAEMAKKYGIGGFCYHYYWFDGKRLLNRPLDEVLESKHPDFPFCVCWANENWTRRWDGQENEILMAQNHSLEDDRKFISSLIPAFLDSRYIRINGRPLLIVYRVSLLPNPRETVEIWRDECRKHGIEDIYLCAAQSFGITDPRPYGFDSAVEFPPHGLNISEVTHRISLTNKDFLGHIFDYNQAADSSLNKLKPDYKLFKTVMPSWDNTARRQNHSNLFINSSPQNYERWLSEVISKTKQTYLGEEQLVFINAWNEWAEGCHLEPDRIYGHEFLRATKNALDSSFLEYSLLDSLRSNTDESNNLKESDSLRYPLVSICIPTCNGKKFIAEAMESAIFQTYPSIEIIVSDDDSNDETIEVVKEYITKYPNKSIRLYTHKQYGLNENWNFCISQVRGKYIKFLFQDDLLEYTCLEKMVELAEKDCEIGIVFSPRSALLDINSEENMDYIHPDQKSRDTHEYWSNLKQIQSGKELLLDPNLIGRLDQNIIGEPSTVLIRSECFFTVGLFDPDLRQVSDMDMWYRIMAQYKVGFIDQTLSKFRVYSDQERIKNKASEKISKDMIRLWRKLASEDSYHFVNPQMKIVVREKLKKLNEFSTGLRKPFTDRNPYFIHLKRRFPSMWELCRRLAIKSRLI